MTDKSLFGPDELPINYGPGIIVREANGIAIRQRADNYFDATAMGRAYGKAFADYSRLNSTKEFLAELSAVMGIPITELVVSIQGGSPSQQGTWVHRRVAIPFACWCSAKLAVMVFGWIDELILGRLPNIAEASGMDPFVIGRVLQSMVDEQRRQGDEQRRQGEEQKRQGAVLNTVYSNSTQIMTDVWQRNKEEQSGRVVPTPEPPTSSGRPRLVEPRTPLQRTGTGN